MYTCATCTNHSYLCPAPWFEAYHTTTTTKLLVCSLSVSTILPCSLFTCIAMIYPLSLACVSTMPCCCMNCKNYSQLSMRFASILGDIPDTRAPPMVNITVGVVQRSVIGHGGRRVRCLRSKFAVSCHASWPKSLLRFSATCGDGTEYHAHGSVQQEEASSERYNMAARCSRERSRMQLLRNFNRPLRVNFTTAHRVPE